MVLVELNLEIWTCTEKKSSNLALQILLSSVKLHLKSLKSYLEFFSSSEQSFVRITCREISGISGNNRVGISVPPMAPTHVLNATICVLYRIHDLV